MKDESLLKRFSKKFFRLPSRFSVYLLVATLIIVGICALIIRSERKEKDGCFSNALVKGRIELPCKDVRAKRVGYQIVVYGCNKSVAYTCRGTTPIRECVN